MVRDSNRAPWLHQFALVIYVPDPLASFLDNLRLELVPGCSPHAHVSVLPPRPLPAPWPDVLQEAQDVAAQFPAFEVEAAGVRIFPATNVIYLDIGRGSPELHRMHDLLSRNSFAHPELFSYQPHITLGQEIPAGSVPEILARAEREWQAYTGPRSFTAENAIFVKNTGVNCWVDMATLAFENGVRTTDPNA